MDKADFIGKSALAGKEKPVRLRVGLTVTGRGIARGGEDLFVDGKICGKTTSGTFSPHLKEAIAMAIIQSEYAVIGRQVEVDVRGRRIEAVIAKLPFYKKQ
jgi:aminomethyltransferase